VRWKRATHRVPLGVWGAALLAMGFDLGRDHFSPNLLLIAAPALCAIAFLASLLRLLCRRLPAASAPPESHVRV
jgi:hypothetical protein